MYLATHHSIWQQFDTLWVAASSYMKTTANFFFKHDIWMFCCLFLQVQRRRGSLQTNM